MRNGLMKLFGITMCILRSDTPGDVMAMQPKRTRVR